MPTGVCVTDRVRSRVPPPHVTEHADHSAHAPTWQSRAHGCVLHVVESLSGGQSAALLSTVRERAIVPPPHGSEQLDHADHADTVH